MNLPALPRRNDDAHKGNFGHVALIGGSRGMAGSIALSSIAALRSGSGLVTTIVPDAILETVAGFHPAIMTVAMEPAGSNWFDEQAADQIIGHLRSLDAIAIGPGMRTFDSCGLVLANVLQHADCPKVIDADAINLIAKLKLFDAPEFDTTDCVLTPHPGELERLTGVCPDHRQLQIDAAIQLSIRTGAVIVVKGGPTVVVHRNHRWTNDTGNPGMATAGSGDVLTGMITSLIGQGMSNWDAARLAVHHHGLAGDLAREHWGQAAMTSLDIANKIRF